MDCCLSGAGNYRFTFYNRGWPWVWEASDGTTAHQLMVLRQPTAARAVIPPARAVDVIDHATRVREREQQ